MHIFFTPEIAKPSFMMNAEESHHAVKVLRLSNGSPIELIDGEGGHFEAEIELAHHKSSTVRIIREMPVIKRPYRLHLAVAPTKNMDRMQFLIEKCTEIGFDEFTPIISARSERKIVKTEKLKKIAIAACKQSKNAFLPVINETMSLKEFLNISNNSEKLIAHCEDEQIKKELKKSIGQNHSSTVLVGPEGDFTHEEIELAKSHGYSPVGLGSSRLRTETAAIVACHTINLNYT